MLKAVNLTTTIEFQSPRDPEKGTDQATKFTLGAIPSRIYTTLKDKATSFTQEEGVMGVRADYRPHAIAYDIVRHGLKNVENFPANFTTQEVRIGNSVHNVVHEDFMQTLDIDTIRELSEAIRGLCEFEVEEIKN